MLEVLEDRRLLTLTDLAAIGGTLYYDLDGEVQQPIPGQVVTLHQDGNGNGLFDGAPTDPLRAFQITDADGRYRFDSLSAGTYFVVQPPEPSGHIQPPPEPIPRTIVITPEDADGTEGLTIDHFGDPQSLVAQQPPAGTPSVVSSIPASTALGLWRTLIVNAVAGTGLVQVAIHQNGNGLFSYAEGPGVIGNATMIWDGTAGDHATPNPIGLAGIDLTGGGVQDSFVVRTRVSDIPMLEAFTIYTDATHASRVEFAVPALSEDIFQLVEFADFVAVPGYGPADFTNVGAITFGLVKDSAYPNFGLDYQLEAIYTVGPTVFTADLPYHVSSELRLTKLTNGVDHHAPPGMLVSAGSMVTWTYQVTNRGNESIAGVAVLDDQPGVIPTPILLDGFNAGDTNHNGLLDSGETWLFTATGIAIAGEYENLGTATGTGAVSNAPLTDTDRDYYFGAQPAIQIVKLTNGTNADNPTGLQVPVGSEVTWTYHVTNPGNVPLRDVTVTDDDGTPGFLPDDFHPVFVGGDTNNNGLLDPGELWVYTATGIAVAGPYVNTAIAEGVDDTGTVPTPTESESEGHYFGVERPRIVLGPDKNPGTPQYVKVVDTHTLNVRQFQAYEPDYVGGARVAVADLDGDGTDEIITAPGRNHPPEVRVFTLDGNPLPGFPGFLAYDPAFMGGVQVTVADVNGDGKPDIITVPSYGAADVRVFLNQSPLSPAFRTTPDITFRAFPTASLGGAVVVAADMGRMVNGSFINDPDGEAEIVVGTGAGSKATVTVFDVSGAVPTPVQTFFPFTALNSDFLGGVSLDVARIDADAIPDVIVGMGVNGTSRIEVWAWDTPRVTLSLLGAIPDAFTGSSNNAPVQVAARISSSGDGVADAIFAVQGPIGTTGAIHRFDLISTAPFQYQQAPPLTGFHGPWFIATSKAAALVSEPPVDGAPSPAAAWTNLVNPRDVNNDGLVSPLDVLETINYINANPGQTAPPAEQFSPPRFFDINADGAITPGDVLVVLNSLNRSSATSGEGETSEPVAAIAGMIDIFPSDVGLAGPCRTTPVSIRQPDFAPSALDAARVSATDGAQSDPKRDAPQIPCVTPPPLAEHLLLELESILDEILSSP
jgi:hypothetical protein